MRALIIGGGLLGLTTAYFLRQHGLEVTVVDREPGPGRATSFANGGMLHASLANPWNEPGVFWHAFKMLGREDAPLLVRMKALPSLLGWGLTFVRHSQPARYLRNFEKNVHLARYSLALMQEFRAVLGTDYDYAGRGTLKLFRSAAPFAAAQVMSQQLGTWGVPYEVLSGAAAVALEPALTPIESAITGGLYFPADESGDAQRFCELLTAHCRAQGVRFEFGLQVQRLLRRGTRIEGVLGSQGLMTADAYVLAAGSYATPLAHAVGVAVPVRPVKGYSLTLDTGDWPGRPSRPVIDDALHAAVCPLGNRLRVAGTAEFAGFDLRLTPARLNNLFDLVTQLYPSIAPHLDRQRAARWCGLRPMSADGVGIMGRTPVTNLYLNTGHGPLGWTMAAGAGRLVADDIAGKPTELNLEAYQLARFG